MRGGRRWVWWLQCCERLPCSPGSVGLNCQPKRVSRRQGHPAGLCSTEAGAPGVSVGDRLVGARRDPCGGPVIQARNTRPGHGQWMRASKKGERCRRDSGERAATCSGRWTANGASGPRRGEAEELGLAEIGPALRVAVVGGLDPGLSLSMERGGKWSGQAATPTPTLRPGPRVHVGSWAVRREGRWGAAALGRPRRGEEGGPRDEPWVLLRCAGLHREPPGSRWVPGSLPGGRG